MELSELLAKLDNFHKAEAAHQKIQDIIDKYEAAKKSLDDAIASLPENERATVKRLIGQGKGATAKADKPKGTPNDAAKKLIQSKVGTGDKVVTFDPPAKKEIAGKAGCSVEDVEATLAAHFKPVRKPKQKGRSNLWANKPAA
jgi:hypothetical protein